MEGKTTVLVNAKNESGKGKKLRSLSVIFDRNFKSCGANICSNLIFSVI